ncbi:hypothetical protein BT96DRAFT_973819 [Gymnopus androsaceus JB14]|uniref:Uncharacterized protein n=1 Tax=Gymnopus androsaceus JB14 TaxID=1447944 RepID=A0A6A4I2V0_9AGAR|nr:hypothetical protein BT96DRAFT_973819 [Gymnopus androsaceus JB14]
MPPPPRKRRHSDADYKPSGSIRKSLKKLRKKPLSPLPQIPCKTAIEGFEADSELDDDFSSTRQRPSPAPLDLEPPPEIIPTTPQRNQDAASRPESLMSVLQDSPAQLRGRPRVRRRRRNPPGSTETLVRKDKQDEEKMQRDLATSSAAFDAKMQTRLDQQEVARDKADKAQNLLCRITMSEDEGGLGFKSKKEFIELLFSTGYNPEIEASITRWCKEDGAYLASCIFERAPEAFGEFLSKSMFLEKRRNDLLSSLHSTPLSHERN